jgi:Zn-finger nucleic acid-binding protein
MPCPSCPIDLQQVSFEGVVIDLCPSCAGIWFDQGELGKIKSSSIHALAELDDLASEFEERAEAQLSKICPRDGTSLTPYFFLHTTNIELDWCPNCNGIWVEDGELAKINELVEERRRTQPQRVQDAQVQPPKDRVTYSPLFGFLRALSPFGS